MTAMAAFLSILSLVAPTPRPRPLATVFAGAVESYVEGDMEAALSGFSEVASRMPGFERSWYNLTAPLFELERFGEADSLMRPLSDCAGGDTLGSAQAATLLAYSMSAGERQGVERAADMLRMLLGDGESLECDAPNLEAALNWLRLNSESQDQQQDRQDEQDQQDRQDEQDQQDQHEQQDEQDQQDEQEQQDQQDQQDRQDQQERQNQQDQQVNPETGMTEDQARMLLDLVEEAVPADSLRGRPAGIAGGPDW